MDKKQKIIDALKTIKTVCENYYDKCEKCPLCNFSGECGVMDLSPCNWKINEPEEIWRALL